MMRPYGSMRLSIGSTLLMMIAALLLKCDAVHAQSWQWGKRGGSWTTPVGGVGFDEMVVDMTTDRNGNVYTISDVYSPGLDIDGHTKPGFGGRDILISSFKCDGSYRWSKIIGSNQSEKSVSIKTDTLGGVYVTGHLITSASALYIDTDTSWTGGSLKTIFLAKLDTSGTYKWLTMPQADTVTAYSSARSGAYDMDVDGAGNVYWMCTLPPGAYAGGSYIVATSSVHMLKYNRFGFFQGGTLMQFNYSGGPSPSFRMKRNHKNGKYLVTGSSPVFSTITFGSSTVPHTLYMGCFNSAGTWLWTQHNKDNFSNGPMTRPAIDAAGNIYALGQARHMDTFNNYVIYNTWYPSSTAFIVKMDSAGNNIWGTNAQSDAEIQTADIVINGNEVVMAGAYPAKLKWDNDSVKHTMGCGYSPFITRLNAMTGAVIELDTLATGCGDNSRPTSITTDRFGNFYIGGYANLTITVAGTTLTKAGGGSDFFVAKYGTASCSCTLPSAAFTSTGTGTKTFTYTGTATYDSVRWDFGDGGTSTLASPTHTFAAGTYTVCVTVYTACGSDVHCQTFTVSPTTEIAGTAFEGLSIYPNPVSGQLFIEQLAIGTEIRIFNIMGTEVYRDISTANRQQIDMRAMPAGSYIIQLTDKESNTLKTLITKL